MEPARGSICRSCRQRLATRAKARTFSTSVSRQVVPPESPYYIDVPASYQPYLPFKKPEKGALPTPRELFPARRPDKPSPEYLDRVAKEPLPKNVLPPRQLTASGKHKAKMAEVRRSQIREGLTSLYARKQAEIQAVARVSQAKQLQRNALLSQREREDARLTSISIPKEMDPNYQSTLQALEAEVATAKRIHETKVANLERVQQKKHAEKMDALHTLYMNARTFVTTEAEYKKLIEEQFTPSPSRAPEDGYRHADFASAYNVKGMSMWNHGVPDSIKKMIETATGSKLKTMGDAVNYAQQHTQAQKAKIAREQERFQKIAEKLSGGKI